MVAVQGFEATLALSKDLGERVPTAVLVTAPYFLLEILARRLEEARRGRLPANRHLALALVGREPVRSLTPPPPPPQPPPQAPPQRQVRAGGALPERPPNCKQQEAIRKALGLEVTFIWGPPGTGKTSTLARLVDRLVAAGERVLIASHTNAAVDVAFEPVADRLPLEARERGMAVRVGTPQRRSDPVQQNTLDAIVERRAAGLTAERREVERRKEELEHRLQRIGAALEVLEGVRKAEQALHAARDAQAQAQRALQAARSESAAAQAQITALRSRLEQAEAMGWLRRALTGMYPASIRQQLAQAEAAGQAAAQRVAVRQQEVEGASAALRQAEAAYREALARRQRLGVVPDEAELRRRQRESSEALEAAVRRLAEIDAAVASLTRVILKEARVVAATLARLSIMDELLAEPYDTVVVDEASVVPIPYLWLAALMARRRVVVAGDFRQLPPIAAADDPDRYPRAHAWLAQDVFKAADILDDKERVRNEDPRLTRLQHQYRMHPLIGELVNELVYKRDNNALSHEVDERSDDVRRGLYAAPEPGHPLVLCDTSGANPWCAWPVGSHSRYNLYSAVVAVRLAALAAQSDPAVTVGLVAPYRAQVRLMQTLAERYGLGSDRVRVATVHRFQGDQQDVIVLDLVDGPPHSIGRLLKGRYVSPATRLLNVACSRARGKLIVVAHTAYFGRLTSEHSLTELLGYLGRHGRWLDARGILAGHNDPDVRALAGVVHRAGAPLPAGVEPVLYHEGSFYGAFRQDLEAARKYVVLYSPYIHANRLADVAPHLRAAVERGVRVTVVTRPADEEEADGLSLQQELARVGIQVIPRRGLHEKIAVIDGQVAWFGSLNILSHSRSTEWMMRFADPVVVGRLAEVTGAAALVEHSERHDALQARRQRLQAALQSRGSPPPCPRCGRPTRLTFGRYGPFYRCTESRCLGTVNLPRPVIQAAVEALGLACPDCGTGRLTARWGRGGAFLSCSRYPDCRHTESL